MYKSCLCFALAAALIGSAQSVSADTIFATTLTGSQEVPPTGSAGTGSETAVLNDSMTQLIVSLTFSGLGSGTTVSHIHCCAPPGVNAPVALPLAGFPTGVTSGSYTHTFTLATDLVGITPAAFTAALLAGNTYANAHTTVFPAGEIRGQLRAVPEPGTFGGLALLFCIGAGAFFRRRLPPHPTVE